MSELKPCPFCGGEAGGSHKRETKSRLLAALSNKGENLSGDVKVSVRGGEVSIVFLSEVRGEVRKMTRSQQRYHDYLKVADCFDSFKDYLLRKAVA